jgi:hypothetical protein
VIAQYSLERFRYDEVVCKYRLADHAHFGCFLGWSWELVFVKEVIIVARLVLLKVSN